MLKAGMNKQISKWFLNNEHCDRKSVGAHRILSKPNHGLAELSEMQESEMVDHMAELNKEMRKSVNHWAVDKMARLLSLTYQARTSEMKGKPNVSNIVAAFPCFKQPVFLLQELFHKCGMTFENLDEVYDAIYAVQKKWTSEIVPALAAIFSTATQYDHEQSEIHEMDCLTMLIEKLKPRNSKVSADERLSHFLCVGESLEDCKAKHVPSHDPYIAVVGAIDEMEDCALISDQKIIFHFPCGCNLANLALVLISFCHFFNLRFSPLVEDVMEFFQSQLIGLSEKKKAHCSLFKFVTVTELPTGPIETRDKL
jgi:hypothetical protein